MKRVVILGATGSIGQSARRVAASLPDRIRIVGMSAHSDAVGLAAAAEEFPGARTVLSSGPGGGEQLCDLARHPDADIVLVAIVGTGGLRPALAAIEAGKDLAVASKEILVMAGEPVMQAAREKGVRILPVDSEHNAIFQCLEGHRTSTVSRLILTCSGGPFRKASREEIHRATPEQALRHPTWSMGRKITVDSATLFNKGLEMIEAHWLFGTPMQAIDVVVHPQSVIHSMVEFVDGSVLAQLSHTDMAFPIQYALLWPDRVPGALPPLDFARLARLDFERPRTNHFPALDLARHAGTIGGTAPAVLNAANEVAVEAFLQRRIPFPDIWKLVEGALGCCGASSPPGLDAAIQADRDARRYVREMIDR